MAEDRNMHELKQCELLLQKLCQEQNVQPFMEPVPWKELGLEDYGRINKSTVLYRFWDLLILNSF